MRSIETIKAAMAALEAELTEAKTAEAEARKAKLAAIPREFDWRVTNEGEYTIRIERKYTDAILATLEALGENLASSFISNSRWNGMSYHLIGDVIVSADNGTVIVNLPFDNIKGWYDRSPRQLPAEDAAALRNGQVPVHMRRP